MRRPRRPRIASAMRAILLCAGKGMRFRPVTEAIPKPLLPFLNVPARASLICGGFSEAGVGEVAVNLHHLGDQIERHLRDEAADLPQLAFFRGARDPRHRRRAAQRRARSWRAATSSSSTPTPRSSPTSRPSSPATATRGAPRRSSSRKIGTRRCTRRFRPKGIASRPSASAAHGRCSTPASACSRRGCSPRIPPGRDGPRRRISGSRCSTRGGKSWASSCMRARTPISAARAISSRASLEALERGGPFPQGGGHFDGRQRVLVREAPSGFDAADERARPRPRSAPGPRILRSARLGRRRGRRGRAPDGLPRGSRPRSGRGPLRESPSLGLERRRASPSSRSPGSMGMIMESTLSLPAGSRGCAPSPSRRRRAGRPCRRARPRGRPSPACSRPSARRNKCRSC